MHNLDHCISLNVLFISDPRRSYKGSTRNVPLPHVLTKRMPPQGRPILSVGGLDGDGVASKFDTLVIGQYRYNTTFLS